MQFKSMVYVQLFCSFYLSGKYFLKKYGLQCVNYNNFMLSDFWQVDWTYEPIYCNKHFFFFFLWLVYNIVKAFYSRGGIILCSV